MLVILVPAGWILFDVLICLRTGYMTKPFPPWEWWTWLISGLLLAGLSIYGQWRESKKHEREMAGLKAGQTQHSQEHDVLASAALKTLDTGSNIALLVQRLENLTNTRGAPIVTTIEMATSKIEGLEQQIKALNERAARRISADQRRKFLESLNRKIPWIREMYCISLDSEAEAYAKQLTRMFREAGMNVGYSFLVDNFDSPTLDQFGLTIHHKIGEFPDDARDLAWALDQAGIKYGLTTERVVSHADQH
jgi:hypothetical protein